MADLVTIKQWLKWLLWLLGVGIFGSLLTVWKTWYEATMGGGQQNYLLAVTVTGALALLWFVVLLFFLSARRLLHLNSFFRRYSHVSARLYWIILIAVFCGLVGYAAYNYITLESNEFTLLRMGAVEELEAQVKARPHLIHKKEGLDGPSLLLAAFHAGDSDIVGMLLKHGAVFDSAENNGRSPVVVSVRDDLMLKTLLDGGVDPDMAGNDGVPPLHYAVTLQNTNAVSLLLEAGAAINAVDREGRTALMRALESCDLTIAECLLAEEGVNINARDRRGDTVLHKTVRCKKDDGIRFLLERGANPAIFNYAGFSPLHVAAICGKNAAVKVLLEEEDVVSLCNNDDQTALDYALKGKKYKTARLLLEGGADIDRIKCNGQTALHALVYAGDYKGARFLIEQGASIDIPDASGMTAHSLIRQKKIKELLAIIEPEIDELGALSSIDPASMIH
jgi:ankyrin repeat protein